jgi:hypothetical protein
MQDRLAISGRLLLLYIRSIGSQGHNLVGCDALAFEQWNTAAPKLLGHRKGVLDVAYSPTGTTIATATLDHTAMLWDSATGMPLCSPLQHQWDVWTVAFSADGKLLLTASMDQSVRLWDAVSGLGIGPVLSHSGPVKAAFRPHTNQVVTLAADDGLLRLWDIPEPAARTVHEIEDSVKALTGNELTDKGVLRDLDRALLQKLWGRCVQQIRGFLRPSTARLVTRPIHPSRAEPQRKVGDAGRLTDIADLHNVRMLQLGHRSGPSLTPLRRASKTKESHRPPSSSGLGHSPLTASGM